MCFCGVINRLNGLTANSMCSLCVLLTTSRSCCRVSGRPADSRYSRAAASLGVTTETLRGSTDPRADMSSTRDTLEPRLRRKDGRGHIDWCQEWKVSRFLPEFYWKFKTFRICGSKGNLIKLMIDGGSFMSVRLKLNISVHENIRPRKLRLLSSV